MTYNRLSTLQRRLFHSYPGHPNVSRIMYQPAFFTSLGLHRQTQPTDNTKMLLRDFIEDSLYNPHYGYHHKSKGEESLLKYSEIDISSLVYSYAVAKYMVAEYKLNLYPHKDLIIYEMVGRDNQLVSHILDYIQKYEPSIYKRTQYNIIPLLDQLQTQLPVIEHSCLNVHDESIFNWNSLVTEQCFILGMEALSHFPHDVIRYDLKTMEAHQGYICIDNDYNYEEIFEPVGTDQLITRYSSIRKRMGPSEKYNKQLIQPARSYLYKLQQMMKYPRVNQQYTYPEYIPTRLLEFLDILATHFPGHRLIMADYASLDNTVEGINGPLVENNGSHLCTYQLSPGHFDIIFPTNFDLLRDTYLLICRGSKAGNEKKVKVVQYDDFIERYNDIDRPSYNKSNMYKLLHKNNVKILFT
ncbi:putative S-adenosyl-L-methionine-dependent methyltransferase-domain-containing protein [Pilobolus umbonatus]|nr:putative S-adenosyl-L-methionine-dependent methyltransferase-domain-containing protein [Pilobolus umbonatus]